MVRASEDARRARSFSRAGGITVLSLALAAAAVDADIGERLFVRTRAAWITFCGALSGRRRVVKRFGGRAKERAYRMYKA
jgi:hypothetical protein